MLWNQTNQNSNSGATVFCSVLFPLWTLVSLSAQEDKQSCLAGHWDC